MNTDSSESRCKITTKNPKKQWFLNQVAVRGTEVSSVAFKNVHLQRFIAVILHPKGKAVGGASISFRENKA